LQIVNGSLGRAVLDRWQIAGGEGRRECLGGLVAGAEYGGKLGHENVAVSLAVGHLLFGTLFCFVHLDESVSCLKGGGEHCFRSRCIRMF
jgi:hypothetical protein